MSDFIDLANQVAIPTEIKEPVASRHDSFLDEPVADPIPGAVTAGPEPEERIKVSEVMDPEESAEVLVSLIDSIQDIGFSAAYAIKLRNKFSREERDQIDKLERKMESEKTEEEKHLEGRFQKAFEKIMAKKNSLNFTEDERRQLQRPAALLIKRSGKDIPPGLALALVSGKIIGDRLIDFVWE